MIVDFRRTRDKPNNVSILGEEVEGEYTYLEVYLDNRTDWTGNATLRQSSRRNVTDYFLRML